MTIKYVALDTETWLIERNIPAPQLVCVSFCCDDLKPFLMLRSPELLVRLRELLEDPEVHLIGHNMAFDMMVICNAYSELTTLIFEAYRAGRIHDTGVRQQLYDIANGKVFKDDKIKGYSLSGLTKLILDIDMEGKEGTDIWRLRYKELDGVSLEDWPKEAITYALNDALYTMLIFLEQNQDFVMEDIVDDARRAYMSFSLSLMSARGMRTKKEVVEKCKEFHTAKKEALEKELVDAGLLEWCKRKKGYVKKQKPARERIEKACLESGVKVPTTKQGAVACDKAAAIWSGDALMLKRAKYTTAEKMLSTYVPALEAGVDGPITTRFNYAATGRTTSSAPKEPFVGTNFQNQPQDGGIRECYYPRWLHVYLAADYEGAELHTLAETCLQVVGYSTLGDMLNAGKDVHLHVAATIMGIPYDEALEMKKAGDETILNGRQRAKPANFGFPGGMKEGGFIRARLQQDGQIWEYGEVKILMQGWFESFPEMRPYFDWVEEQMGPEGAAKLALHYSGRIRGLNSANSAKNYFFQGPAADGGLMGISEVTRRCFCEPDSYLYYSRPCNFVHDEIVMELTEDEFLHEKAMEVKKVMEDEFNIVTPNYPVTVEPVLMRYWSKKAKQVFDSNGRLIPWEG